MRSAAAGFGSGAAGVGAAGGASFARLSEPSRLTSDVDHRLFQPHFGKGPGPMQQRGGGAELDAQQRKACDRRAIGFGQRQVADLDRQRERIEGQ